MVFIGCVNHYDGQGMGEVRQFKAMVVAISIQMSPVIFILTLIYSGPTSLIYSSPYIVKFMRIRNNNENNTSPKKEEKRRKKNKLTHLTDQMSRPRLHVLFSHTQNFPESSLE